MQKILNFVAVTQFHAKIIQNRLLAAADCGLIDTQRIGYFGFYAFLPKQLFDQPPLPRSEFLRPPSEVVLVQGIGCTATIPAASANCRSEGSTQTSSTFNAERVSMALNRCGG